MKTKRALRIQSGGATTRSENPNGIPSQSPGLRGTSYPGCRVEEEHNPHGVASRTCARRDNPVGVESHFLMVPQGSSYLATLGWKTQSFRDWCRTGSQVSFVFVLLLALVVCLPLISHAQSCVQWVKRTSVGSYGQRYRHAMAYDSDRGVTVFFGGEIGKQ